MNTANGNFEITENLDSLTYGFLGLGLMGGSFAKAIRTEIFTNDVIVTNFPFLLNGIKTTLVLAVWSILFSLLLGTILGILRYFNIPIISFISAFCNKHTPYKWQNIPYYCQQRNRNEHNV